MIFDTSWSKLRRILELCSASQLVTGGLGVTLAQKKTLQGLAFQSLSQWRLLRRKSFSSLALSILLRQSNKRNYYTMMLSHTVFSTLRMHQTSRVSRKGKFGSLEAKKMFNLIIIMMSGARLTRLLKNDAKKNLQIIWFAFWLLSNFLFNHTVIGWWKGKTSTIF